MEIKKATIKREASNTYLVLEAGEKSLEIILTEDNPNNVKTVFNSLLLELKKGIIQFNLIDETDDLFYNICTEYITQLNSELKSIYEEFVDYKLI